MTTKEIAALLGTDERYVRKSKGLFRWHKSYYLGMTQSAQPLVAKVTEKIPNAIIIDSGNHYHNFVGGAKSGSAQDSFLWVKFTVKIP